MRTRTSVALLAVSTLLLAGCETTGDDPPSGAVVGAATGAAAGLGSEAGIRIASGGHTGNPLLGLLVGGLVGGAVGLYASGEPALPKPIPKLGEADQKLADQAVAQSVNAGIGQRIHWKSEADESISGWAEAYPVDEPVEGRECREMRMYYNFGDTPRVEAKVYCREDGRWVQAPPA